MNFFEQFGVQPVLLLAQAVNFLILLFLLNKFLYKPILKVLESRRLTIAKSLEDAEKITQELEKTEQDRAKKMDQAMLEAKELIADAKNQSLQIIEQAKEQASVEVASMLAQAKTDIQNEHQQMQSSLRAEISTLVFSSLDKIISTEIPASQKAKITAKITKDFKN
jgi:F-type H+-transporting ATPase subunit b